MSSIRFHHYGLAVNGFENALKFHINLGYVCSKPIVDELQKVELIMCDKEGFPSVELVKPVNEESPINTYLKKNSEIIYHVCYEVEDSEVDVKKLFSENRAICVSKPKPAILFNNRKVSFYYVKDIGLIEVLEA